MSPRTRSRIGPPPQKPQSPQKPEPTPIHLRRRPTRPAAAETRETAAQIRAAAGPQHVTGPASYFCGDSRDFCGNHPHTSDTADQAARTHLFADSAVSAALALSPHGPEFAEETRV